MEQDMGDVKSILGQMVPLIVRIDATLTATLPHLATKAELQSAFGTLDGKIGAVVGNIGTLDGKIGSLDGKIGSLDGKIGSLDGKIGDLRSEMHGELGKLRAELAEKPSKTYLWMVLGVLIMAYAAGLAGLAVLK
ncbi:MAG TPA: hypothetical protein VK741_28765 [Acetobacteraceae bacterium]|nr:hypothetical protein [Acetobacteraceae bacterium]